MSEYKIGETPTPNYLEIIKQLHIECTSFRGDAIAFRQDCIDLEKENERLKELAIKNKFCPKCLEYDDINIELNYHCNQCDENY